RLHYVCVGYAEQLASDDDTRRWACSRRLVPGGVVEPDELFNLKRLLLVIGPCRRQVFGREGWIVDENVGVRPAKLLLQHQPPDWNAVICNAGIAAADAGGLFDAVGDQRVSRGRSGHVER